MSLRASDPAIIPERFWARLAVNEETGCWEWQGARQSAGYGNLGVGVEGKTRWYLVHRFFYEALAEPITDGLTLDHLCENLICASPDHLEPVTSTINLQRRRLAKAHCHQGHPYDLLNTIYTSSGARRCRKCQCASARRWKSKQRAKEEAAA